MTDGMVWAVLAIAIILVLFMAIFPFIYKGNGGSIGGNRDD